MNILVIGNGFDLAHGLPTKYTDFLNFCTMVRKIYEDEKINNHLYKVLYLDKSNFNEEIKQQLLTVFASREDHRDITNDSKIVHTFTTDYPRSDELYALIKDNFWIEYFLSVYKKREKEGKNGWIDFESEISGAIQGLENDIYGLNNSRCIDDSIEKLSNNILHKKYLEIIDGRVDYTKGVTYKRVRNQLLIDLNKLIRALEIYLCEYVEKTEIRKKSPDIRELNIDFVLSFNYTHTFSKLYEVSSEFKHEIADSFDYIHGEISTNNTIESNNMVLGIDEYLSDDRRNKDVEFIAFKKFYQRIYKQTGCKYKKWLDQIQNKYDGCLEDEKRYTHMIMTARQKGNYEEASQWNSKRNKIVERNEMDNVYIFGHSLDITDKDILRDLILNDNVYTTIFYHDKDTMGKQIANLVKVIGQDELIRRTGGNTKTIEFKLQQDMIPAIN